MASPRVGVQLIVFGERPQTDLKGVLVDVASAEYDGFEGGGVPSPEEEARVRSAMEGLPLDFIGGHYGINQLADLEAVEQSARHICALGGEFMMVSGRYDTLEGYREGVAILNQAGERCRRAEVTLCYHNHNWELEKIDGTVPLDLLLQETDADLVKLCPDIYWLHVGGQSPPEFLRRHGARCPCIHFKDGLAGDQIREFRELGRGNIEVAETLEAALEIEPKWIIVEQDATKRHPAESVRISREYLQSLGL